MPLQGDIRAKNVTEVLPGVQLFKQPKSIYLSVRVLEKNAQWYIKRSTGKETVPEATQWVMTHLQELFALKPVERGGGVSSLIRLISTHLEYQQQRQLVGEISEATLTIYNKSGRHFMKWLLCNGYKRPSDIERTSLRSYAMDRVSKDGLSPNTVNLEVVYFSMFWSWLQSEELVARSWDMLKLRQAIENRTGGESFADGDLKQIRLTLPIVIILILLCYIASGNI